MCGGGVAGLAADEQGMRTPRPPTAGIAGRGLVFAAGIAVVWARSEVVGAPPIAEPTSEVLHGAALEREDKPAEGRIRLTLAVRLACDGTATPVAQKVRVNVPLEALVGEAATPALAEGAVVRLRAPLMPPAPPMLSGAFASGDRGSFTEADEIAMRDSGLTHLLSISGLQLSALIAAAYSAVLKLLALWPALALRVCLPVVAASAGALAGIGYTLLIGAEVPTVRSCVAALLVLGALVLGRDALSLWTIAVAGGFALKLWPESAISPSFQMSFAAVLAIIALSSSAPVLAFLAAREEPWWTPTARRVAMLFATGVVI
jgi:competence protein ComEC